MKCLGTDNLSGYIRKMAIDGMVIKIDIAELKEICTLLRYSGNNLNQIAKRLNENRQVYSEDIQDIKNMLGNIYDAVNKVNMKLSEI